MFELKFIFFAIHLITVCYTRDSLPDHTDKDFQKECLSLANNYRKKHQAPALKIDEKAVEYSKERCKLISKKNGLKHGYAGLKDDFGETQFWKSGSGLALCANAIEHWYEKEDEFNFKKPEENTDLDHFSQLVWIGSTGIGCARCGGKETKGFETYVVCEFTPPGNMGGEYKDNVKPASRRRRRRR